MTLPSRGRLVADARRLLRHEHRLPEPIAGRGPAGLPTSRRSTSRARRRGPSSSSSGCSSGRAGTARWLKNWTGGREMCIDVGRARPLPAGSRRRHARAHRPRRAAIATGGGAWDILAWRGQRVPLHRVQAAPQLGPDCADPAGLAGGGHRGGFDGYAIVEYEAPLIGSPPPARCQRPRRRPSELPSSAPGYWTRPLRQRRRGARAASGSPGPGSPVRTPPTTGSRAVVLQSGSSTVGRERLLPAQPTPHRERPCRRPCHAGQHMRAYVATSGRGRPWSHPLTRTRHPAHKSGRVPCGRGGDGSSTVLGTVSTAGHHERRAG